MLYLSQCLGNTCKGRQLRSWGIFSANCGIVMVLVRFFPGTQSFSRPTYGLLLYLVFNSNFRLLLIITIAENDPTTAEPKRMRMTGILMAQTRGGKREWRGWSSSTKGSTTVSTYISREFGNAEPLKGSKWCSRETPRLLEPALRCQLDGRSIERE